MAGGTASNKKKTAPTWSGKEKEPEGASPRKARNLGSAASPAKRGEGSTLPDLYHVEEPRWKGNRASLEK